MAEEVSIGVGEELAVEMVECAPPEPTREPIPLPDEPADSPIQQGFKAEIEHVGAQPPPEVMTNG